jgi:hypothetical protein
MVVCFHEGRCAAPTLFSVADLLCFIIGGFRNKEWTLRHTRHCIFILHCRTFTMLNQNGVYGCSAGKSPCWLKNAIGGKVSPHDAQGIMAGFPCPVGAFGSQAVQPPFWLYLKKRGLHRSPI